jgi:hypothetical protein
MENKKCTIIEIVADYIYFVITGTKNEIDSYCKLLGLKCSTKKFISMRIDIPIAFYCEKMEKKGNMINIESGTESAQSYAFAQQSYIIKNKSDIKNDTKTNLNNRSHMLMIIEDNRLMFPKLDLHDDDDPEEVVFKWLTQMNGDIPKMIKQTIKPISLVGFNEDILVYTAKL